MTETEPLAPLGVVSERQVRCALDVTAAAWLIEAKDLEGARRVLESAITIVPHDVPARSILAMVLFRLRDFIAASELYERLLSEFRGDISLTFNLALCHLKSGRADAAVSGFRSVLAARPDHPRARVWLRVAEAAVEASTVAPAARASRTSVRPSRLDDLPRVTLPPGASVAKDATGVVSVRVRSGMRWLARPDALQGYAGDVTLEARATDGDRVVSLSGNGTAFLRAKDALVVIELHDETTCVRASSLIAYSSTLLSEAADPEVVGEFDEDILRFSGAGTIVMEARAELVALPVSLTHATTVRWDNVVGWTGNVIGAPSDAVGPDGHALARFAGNGSLLLAMHDAPDAAPVVDDREWYGRYQVLRRLEGTASEEVLLARSHGPGGFQRKVILKRHLARRDGDSHSLQLIAREAHAYALLTHPGIVRLYDFLLLDGHPVLVLEYVSGVSLAAMRTALREQGRPTRDELALYIAHGVFSALAAAHSARDPDTGEFAPVIHRGLRPANVLIGWNGDVKVANFATPKAVGRSPRLAQSDLPPDALGYIAPEQMRGGPLTVSTDVYVAALLLQEMLADGRGLDSLASHAAAESHPVDLDGVLSDLSPPVRDLLRIALAPDPAIRSVSAADLAHALEEAVDLRAAQTLCVDELASLRESAFEHMPKSSRPPPPTEEEAEDSGFFRDLRLPKPSPVPRIALDPLPALVALDPLPALVGTFEAAPQVADFQDEATAGTFQSAPSPPDTGAANNGAPKAEAANPGAANTANNGTADSGASDSRVSIGRSLAAVALHPSERPPTSHPPTLAPWVRAVASRLGSERRRATVVTIGIAAAVAAGAGVGTWEPRPSSAGRAAATETLEGADRPPEARFAGSPSPELSAGPRAAATLTVPSPPLGDLKKVETPEPSASASDPTSDPVIPLDGGILHTPARAAQHRIYLDGRVIGEGEGDYPVPCGTHSVRVGSKGEDVDVQIPCGGLVAIE